MKLTQEEAQKLLKKLEYNFKKKKTTLVDKLLKGSDVELTQEESDMAFSKLESKFKNSGDVLVKKLSK